MYKKSTLSYYIKTEMEKQNLKQIARRVMTEFYINKDIQEKKLRKYVKVTKPKIEYGISNKKLTKSAMLNDIIIYCKQLNSSDEDDKVFAQWMLSKYAEFFEQKPQSKFKTGCLSNFVKNLLTKEQSILKAEYDKIKDEKKEKKEKEDTTKEFTEKEIEDLIRELI